MSPSDYSNIKTQVSCTVPTSHTRHEAPMISAFKNLKGTYCSCGWVKLSLLTPEEPNSCSFYASSLAKNLLHAVSWKPIRSSCLILFVGGRCFLISMIWKNNHRSHIKCSCHTKCPVGITLDSFSSYLLLVANIWGFPVWLYSHGQHEAKLCFAFGVTHQTVHAFMLM